MRIMQTIVNLGVLTTMLCLGFSGIVLSRYVFSFVQGGPMATARTMHLAASYWGFVLMGLHAGLHWRMILGMARKFKQKKIANIRMGFTFGLPGDCGIWTILFY